VQALWFACGCRSGRKYRICVRSQIRHYRRRGLKGNSECPNQPRRGKSARQTAIALRGEQWLTANARVSPRALPWTTRYALGHLSPEARWWAARDIMADADMADADADEPPGWHPLDWAAVRMLEHLRRRDTYLDRLIRASRIPRRLAESLGLPTLRGQELAQAIRAVHHGVAAMTSEGTHPRLVFALAQGHTPARAVDIYMAGPSAEVLTKAEIRRVLAAPVQNWKDRPSAVGLAYPGTAANSFEVARWESTHSHLAAYSERRQDRPCLADIVDALVPADVQGDPSPRVVLTRYMDRVADWRTSTRVLDAWQPGYIPRDIQIMRTGSQLASLGSEQKHCVGGYADRVADGHCHIVAIRSRHGVSTAEITPSLGVIQHRAKCNSNPHPRHKQLLRAWLNRLRRTTHVKG
jgi:hypothetical protein